jgi:hypothetical protein
MGRYVVEGLLGPGGVTETYLARLSDESSAERLFALKLLRADRVPEAAFAVVAARFVAAGRRLLELRRPGFANVVEVSDDPAATFIVSELVPGHDLGRLLALSKAEGGERAGVDPALVGLVGAEIARLLQVAHTLKPPLFHLGLSPQNVIVTDDGEVVLLDAGIASAIRDLTEQAPERIWCVAPELVHGTVGGERQAVAADLYGLGALLHYLVMDAPVVAESLGVATPLALPGASPKLNAALRALLAAWWEERPESAVAVIDRLSGGVDAVPKRQRLIAQGLHKAAEEAREAAARARPGEPAAPIQVPLPADSMVDDAFARALPGVGRPRGRRRRLWSAAGFAALGVAATAGAWFGAFDRGAAPTTTAERGGAAGSLAPSSAPSGPPVPEADPGAPSRERILAHLAGHLVAETVPPGAVVWIDGVRRATTFADLEVGPGSHRVVLTLPGHHSFRDIVDTGRGAIVRRNLAPLGPAERPTGFVRVECQTVGKLPILIDDEETGAVCPELRLPVRVGRRTVGIYLPDSGRVVSVEVSVEARGKPAVAKFSE